MLIVPPVHQSVMVIPYASIIASRDVLSWRLLFASEGWNWLRKIPTCVHTKQKYCKDIYRNVPYRLDTKAPCSDAHTSCEIFYLIFTCHGAVKDMSSFSFASSCPPDASSRPQVLLVALVAAAAGQMAFILPGGWAPHTHTHSAVHWWTRLAPNLLCNPL